MEILLKREKGSGKKGGQSTNSSILKILQSEPTPAVLETFTRLPVHVPHDVVDPRGVFGGGIQFDEVVEAAFVEGTVAFECIDFVQALFVGDFEDFAFDLVAVRGISFIEACSLSSFKRVSGGLSQRERFRSIECRQPRMANCPKLSDSPSISIIKLFFGRAQFRKARVLFDHENRLV